MQKQINKNTDPNWWKTYKLPFGNTHFNETIYNILINDYSYIKWLDCVQLDKTTRQAVDCAIEYYNTHFA